MPDVPNTITDQQSADLARRAQGAASPETSRQAVRQRLNSESQRQRADQS